MSNQSFSCFLIGDGTLLQECGDILRKRSHEILGVITSSTQLSSWAQDAQLEVVDASSDYRSIISARPFDYLFSITHLQKIADDVLVLKR